MFFEISNAKKQEKKVVSGIFENSYFRNQDQPTKKLGYMSTWLIDFDKLSFYHGPIAILI